VSNLAASGETAPVAPRRRCWTVRRCRWSWR